MKRIIVILLVLSASTIYATAQSARATPTEAKWERFQPPAEEFFLETPTELTVGAAIPGFYSRRYFGDFQGTFFYVFSDPVGRPSYYATINGHLKAWGQGTGEEKPDTTPRTLAFDDPYGYHQRVVILKTTARIYVVQTVSKTANDDVAARIMSSFGIGDNLLTAASTNTTSVEPESGQKEVTVSKSGGTGSGFGSGSGSGNGTGIGSGIDSGSATPPSNPMAPLRIISKPRPGYTDLARFYSIQGTIRLRVTFLAAGQVGTVIATSTLPFGLTQTAIDAAKRIQFEPAYQDGKPVTVTKLLEYNYAIY